MNKIFKCVEIEDSKTTGCEFLLHEKYMKLPFVDIVNKFYKQLGLDDGGFKVYFLYYFYDIFIQLIPPKNKWSPDLNTDVLNTLFDNQIDAEYTLVNEKWQIMTEGIYQKKISEEKEKINIPCFINDIIVPNNYYRTIKSADDAIRLTFCFIQ